MRKFLLIIMLAIGLVTFQTSPCLALSTVDLGKAQVNTQAEAAKVLKNILLKNQPGIYQVELVTEQDYDVNQLKEQAFDAMPAGNLIFFAGGAYYQGEKLVVRVDRATLRADNPSQYGAIIAKAKSGKLKNFSVLITDYRQGLYNLSPSLSWTWQGSYETVGTHGMLVTFKVPVRPENKTTGSYSAANSAQLKNVLNTALKNLNGSIKVRVPAGTDTKTVTRIMADLEDESLYIEYVKAWSCRIYNRTLTMSFTYPYNYSTMKQLQANTEAKAVKVIAGIIKPGMVDYEKVLAINNYIVANTYYDKNDLYLGVKDDYNQLAAGPLLRGKAVCGGYSRATQYLLRKARIPCLFVTGTANNGESVEDHAWNMVFLNNGKYPKFYNLDTTWNDSDDFPNYAYFLLDDQTLARNHTWDRTKYPKCPDNSYYYYKVYKLVAEDEQAFGKLTSRMLDNKQTSFSFLSRNFDETWMDTAFHILRDKGLHKTISYSIDPYTNVVSIRFLPETSN